MQPLPSTAAITGSYEGWVQQQAARATHDLKYEGQSYRESRMAGDTTFSRGEVAEMMDGQLQTVLGAALKAQDTLAEGSKTLMTAILRDTDRQRVPVEIDANAVLAGAGSGGLSAIELAEQRLAAKGGSAGGGRLGALPSMGGGDKDKQLADAYEEIRKLNEKMRAMTAHYEKAMTDKSQANANMLSMQDTVSSMQMQQEEMSLQQQQAMQQQNAQFKTEIVALQQQLAASRGETVEAQRELTGKLSQSTQFTTLKKMLNEKNDLVKTLRSSLARYDPAAAAVGADDDIEAMDDDDE